MNDKRQPAERGMTSAEDGRAQALARMHDELKRASGRIGKLVGEYVDPAQYCTLAWEIFRRGDDRMLKVVPASFVATVAEIGHLGLSLNPSDQEVHLIPRWNKHIQAFELTHIIDYRGLLKLARRSDDVGAVQAFVVREGEPFRMVGGTERPRIEHEINIDEEGEVIAAYAVAWLRSDPKHPVFTAVGPKKLTRAREAGGQRGDSAWNTDFDEMAKKTALRRLCKVLPKHDTLRLAVSREEMREAGKDPPPMITVEQEPKVGPAVGLDALLPAPAPAPAPEPPGRPPPQHPITTEDMPL